MEKKSMKFHEFKFHDFATLIIIEPKKREYIWTFFYLDHNMRNSIISREIVKYALFYLKGLHHIHWLKDLQTFKKLSKQLKWSSQQNSAYFHSCTHSTTPNLAKKGVLFPLLKKVIIHRITYRKPEILIFKSKKDEKIIFNLIRENYALR